MIVVAFVAEAGDAAPVVTWAGRFAVAKGAELVVFYVPGSTSDDELSGDAFGEDEFGDETRAAVSQAVETIVRTKRARKGRLPRHAVTLRRVSATDPVTTTVSRVHVESPDLFVGNLPSNSPQNNGKSIVRQIIGKLTCDSILLAGNGSKRVVVSGKGILLLQSGLIFSLTCGIVCNRRAKQLGIDFE